MIDTLSVMPRLLSQTLIAKLALDTRLERTPPIGHAMPTAFIQHENIGEPFPDWTIDEKEAVLWFAGKPRRLGWDRKFARRKFAPKTVHGFTLINAISTVDGAYRPYAFPEDCIARAYCFAEIKKQFDGMPVTTQQGTYDRPFREWVDMPLSLRGPFGGLSYGQLEDDDGWKDLVSTSLVYVSDLLTLHKLARRFAI